MSAEPASNSIIPLADQQLVYRVLADHFPFGKPIPMATISFALMEAGVDKEAYGFKKMKAFLAEMGSFLSFTDILAGGVPQRLVTLNKREDWTAYASEPAEPAGTDEQPTSPAGPAPYAGGGIPRGICEELRPSLSSFVFLPPSTLDILRQHLPAGTDAPALLEADWARAFADGTLRYYEGKVIFPLSALRADGQTPIEISIRHVTYENPEEKPWYLSYVDTYVRPRQPQALPSPSKELEHFAWLGTWSDFLAQLAKTALPESWDFEAPDERPAGQRPYAILKSFICTTFYRLKLEDKICVDDTGTFAAFNTGLFDRHYDDIYACFEPAAGTRVGSEAPSPDHAPWRFVGLCTKGIRALGKRLVSTFNPLPEPASYFESKDDLLYDLERELVVDYGHVLIDNIGRLPVAFLREELGESGPAASLLDEAEAPDVTPVQKASLLSQVGGIVEQDARLFRRLRWRLEDAVDVARRRIRWNYKTAIPSYYPRANAMSLLLPLCLVNDDVADVALVVQLMPSGIYQGQTILTMRQAYMNARLICRPDSDWLTTVNRAGAEEDEDEG